MSHVFLVGFMGAGKSTVGAMVAARLGMPFLDLDREIERREAATVADIFAEEGEAGFRRAEHDALAAVAEGPAAVVACGGGVVLADDNRRLLKERGRVVYLRVTAEEALARLGSVSDRPLLAGEARAMAPTLLASRERLYEAVADATVDTSGRGVEEVAEETVGTLGAVS